MHDSLRAGLCSPRIEIRSSALSSRACHLLTALWCAVSPSEERRWKATFGRLAERQADLSSMVIFSAT